MFEFAQPWLFLLLPIPAAVYWLMTPSKNQDNAVRVPFYQTLVGLDQSSRSRAQHSVIQKILLLCCWALLITAAARPQWVGEPIQLPNEGRDLLLAVDISGSMDTPDMQVNGRQLSRVNVVKYVVGDFVKRRETDRLGLILFGSQAYLQAPLTYDRSTVDNLLQEAQLGFAGQQTAIGDAIGLAIKRLRDRPAESRVLILLTDGANTAGEVDPRQAADLAKLAGIKIYTVGVGADEMIQDTFFGRRKINPSAELDENTLTYIAKQTGGAYFRARGPEDLIAIYEKLDQLEPIEQQDEVFRPISPLFYWPLAISLLCSLMIAALRVDWSAFSPNPNTQL